MRLGGTFGLDFGATKATQALPKTLQNEAKINEKKHPEKAYLFKAIFSLFFSILDLKIHGFLDQICMRFWMEGWKRKTLKIELPPRREHDF